MPLHVFQLDITSNHPVWNLKGSLSLFIHPGNTGNKTRYFKLFFGGGGGGEGGVNINAYLLLSFEEQSSEIMTGIHTSLASTDGALWRRKGTFIYVTRDFILKGKKTKV